MNKWIIITAAAALAASCKPSGPTGNTSGGVEPDAQQHQKDRSELLPTNAVDAVVHLDQGWDEAMREGWYTTSQGSRLIPYSWYLALPSAYGGKFHSEETYVRYRYLLEKTGQDNPDQLPVGFVKDLSDAQYAKEYKLSANAEVKDYDPTGTTLVNEPYLGLTCAGCHTSQINTTDAKGKKIGIRIDGAGAQSDFEGFLVELVDSMDTTRSHPKLWSAFSKEVLGASWSTEADAQLRKDFDSVYATRLDFNNRTTTTVKGGFARLDAFTGILNQVTEHWLKEPGNHEPLLNPVSYPHVWDTPYYDWIEWNGLNSNNGLGPLGRNVGEVLGSFASLEVVTANGPELLPPGYPSTARMDGMDSLEDWARQLQAPPWPTNLWGEIDAASAAMGKTLYDTHCVSCHPVINRLTHVQTSPPLDPSRKEKGLSIISVMVAQELVGTDPNMAKNISSRTALTGALEGQGTMGIGGDPKTFPAETSAVNLLRHFVASAISKHLDIVLIDQAEAWDHKEGTQTEVPPKTWVGDKPENEFDAYRARALSGIWATAPYLHNGSVLTLADLLLPPAERPKLIQVGSYVYDPVKLGLAGENVCPDEWLKEGSAWDGEPEADFGGATETAKVKEANPNMSKCVALGYHSNVDPSDPTAQGNWASGHDYGTDLSEADRAALLEYIKTL